MKTGRLEYVYASLLLIVFGGIVLHAPLTVFFGTALPDYALLIKAWKEILLFIALLLACVLLQKYKLWSEIWRDVVIRIAAIYALIHVVLLPYAWQGIQASAAGILIDLRYVLFFVLVYLLMRIAPQFRRPVIYTVSIGALVVIVFGFLQVTVLPRDILAGLGYDKYTSIAPFLTVDQNPDYVRINSTLRGPNPLGAYVVIVLALLAAWWIKVKKIATNERIAAIIVFLMGSVVLWVSYSRSAVLAAVVALGLVAAVTLRRYIGRKVWIIGSVILLALVGGLFAARDTHFISQVVLHEDPNGGQEINSNEGHVDSLIDGTDRMLRQPFGAGIGSTGSASLLGQEPIIIENQYLLIAHEVGWLGLVLFVTLYALILHRLWKRRDDYLALGVWASGIGLAVIGLLLPVWVDDTVSIVWWGLAATALGSVVIKKGKNQRDRK